MTRPSLRAVRLEARAALPADQRKRLDAALGTRLKSWVETHCQDPQSPHHAASRPFVLGLYWPIRGEPDWRILASDWWDEGFTLALPVMNPKDPAQCTDRQPPGGLTFCRWDRDTRLERGPFGVPVPAEQQVVLPDCLIVPCVGFCQRDGRLWRLGYGGGYYDRTLAHRPVPAVGVAYDQDETGDFLPLATDWPLVSVLTPTRGISPI